MASFSLLQVNLKAKNGCEFRVDLRHCAPEDAILYPEFSRTIASETTHTLQTPEEIPEIDKVRANWEKTLENQREIKIGVFFEGRLIGQAALYSGADHIWTRHRAMFGMMVIREFWGMGLGRILLGVVENFAKDIGIRKMEANVRTENERGLSLYTKVGYRIEGTRTRAALINGRFHDEYWIAKDLDADNAKS